MNRSHLKQIIKNGGTVLAMVAFDLQRVDCLLAACKEGLVSDVLTEPTLAKGMLKRLMAYLNENCG